MKKDIVKPEDLLELKFVGSVVLSPDESEIFFTAKQAADNKQKYYSHIYRIGTDGKGFRQFTFGEVSDSGLAISPDGDWLYFVSKRNDKKGIYRIPTSGGEAEVFADVEGSYSDLSVSPDGKSLLCVFKKPDEMPRKDGKKVDPVYRHITRLFYKLDSEGFLGQDRGNIWVYDVDTKKGKQITKMKDWIKSPVWFPGSDKIAFASNTQRDPDRDALKDDIFVVSAGGGKPRKLNKPDGPAELLSVSPDGKYVAFIGHDEPDDAWGVANYNIWRVPVGRGEAENLTPKIDRMAIDLTISDTAEGFGGMKPHWSPDGKFIYFQVTDSGATHLARLSVKGGSIRKIVGGKKHVSMVSFASSSRTVALAISDPTTPAEIHISTSGPNSRPKKLTSLNDDYIKSTRIQKPREVIAKGYDGYPIHGWILTPPGFSPNRKYPSILEIHGGPRVQYGYSFFHEMQYLAALGYVVYWCNPRGGQGYGRKHAESIVNAWGSVDYQDCMAFAEYMTEQKYIDKKKMGVTGGSYGGYMTNWIVGHTNMFKAAVTQRSVVNMISMYGASDIGYTLPREIQAGDPYSDNEAWWEMSPIKHVKKIRTPLLIIHSEQDLRCPIEQGEQLFIALKMLRRKVEMVRFPGEPHGLSRAGRPDRRMARLQWISSWFDRYLKGKRGAKPEISPTGE